MSLKPQRSAPGNKETSQVESTKAEIRSTTMCDSQDVRLTNQFENKDISILVILVHSTIYLCIFIWYLLSKDFDKEDSADNWYGCFSSELCAY
jgi:hypothetical protein